MHSLPGAVVVLVEDGQETVLSLDQSRVVLQEFPELGREARRWAAKLGQETGRLLLVDEDTIAQVRTFLTAAKSKDQFTDGHRSASDSDDL